MENHNREIIAELPYDNLIPFLRPHLKPRLAWGFWYWVANVIPLAALIIISWSHGISLDTFLTNAGLGFWMFFLLLPIHELIHAAAYKIVGAPRVGFGADLKKLVFYATADQFMVDRKKFLFVALAPFVLISTALIIALFFFSYPSNLIILSALILHTGGCFGDFALVSFMHQHRDKNIFTMDDVKAKKAYFFTVAEN